MITLSGITLLLFWLAGAIGFLGLHIEELTEKLTNRSFMNIVDVFFYIFEALAWPIAVPAYGVVIVVFVILYFFYGIFKYVTSKTNQRRSTSGEVQ